jgi:intracellular septation protein
MKTTIVYGLFAGILGVGLLQGRSYLAYVLHEMMPMQETGWMILTRRLCFGFAALAVANEVVWRTLSTDLWVKIETFGFPILLFLYLWWQVMALQKYLIDPADRDL